MCYWTVTPYVTTVIVCLSNCQSLSAPVDLFGQKHIWNDNRAQRMWPDTYLIIVFCNTMCSHDVTVRWYFKWNGSNLYWIFTDTSAFAFDDRSVRCHFVLDMLSPGRCGGLWFIWCRKSFITSYQSNLILLCMRHFNLFNEGLVNLVDNHKHDSSYQNCYLTSNIQFCKTSNIFSYDDCLNTCIWNIVWRWPFRSVCSAMHFIPISFLSKLNEFTSNGVTHVNNLLLLLLLSNQQSEYSVRHKLTSWQWSSLWTILRDETPPERRSPKPSNRSVGHRRCSLRTTVSCGRDVNNLTLYTAYGLSHACGRIQL
jgi:hypothetical protein